jgi:hypothetical protein
MAVEPLAERLDLSCLLRASTAVDNARNTAPLATNAGAAAHDVATGRSTTAD